MFRKNDYIAKSLLLVEGSLARMQCLAARGKLFDYKDKEPLYYYASIFIYSESLYLLANNL
jgi:hypothetical protein